MTDDLTVRAAGLRALAIEQDRARARAAGHSRRHCKHRRDPHTWRECPGNQYNGLPLDGHSEGDATW